MGHQRLGKLPATKEWREIIEYIISGKGTVAELANKVFNACDNAFSFASKDPAFKETIHLLCKIPIAAKSDNLISALAELGIKVPENPIPTR